ncbi:MAG: co-chaperone GroES [Candidatus Kerfeldbacteria bacterium]|nr:co-chaperone GroES [Candidatus Kerfeldbacteria bacterium]
MVQLKPLGAKALIKPVKEEKMTKSGIVLPDTVEKEELEQGEVIAVGEGKRDHGQLVPMTVKVGDRVILKKYGPDKVKIDGQDFLVADEDDIVGIIQS